MVVLGGRNAQGDEFLLTDGRTVKDFFTTELPLDPTGSVALVGADQQNRRPTSRRVPWERITEIRFQDVAAGGVFANGRVVHIHPKNGESVWNLRLLRATRENVDIRFYTEMSSGTQREFLASGLASIQLAPPAPLLERNIEVSGSASGPDPNDADAMAMLQGAPGMGFLGGGDDGPTLDDLATYYATRTAQGRQGAFLTGPGEIENPVSLQSQGVPIAFGAMLIMMTVTFLFGTVVLLFSAKTAGVTDLTVTRAIITSFLLAFIPTSLFALAWLIIPVFIALKIFVGVGAFYISARMIIGGALEVLEDKATSVFVTFYGILIVMICLYWIAVRNG